MGGYERLPIGAVNGATFFQGFVAFVLTVLFVMFVVKPLWEYYENHGRRKDAERKFHQNLEEHVNERERNRQQRPNRHR